jgi:hypothetical protein
MTRQAGRRGDGRQRTSFAREGGLSGRSLLLQYRLAIADFAKQKQVFYLAGEPLTDAMVWSAGNKYTFRLRPSNYMQAAMLAEEAAKLPAKRWATIAPNYEYGQSAVAVFKQLLSAKRPDIEWVGEQWPRRARSTRARSCRRSRPCGPKAS